jgi:hypothetical protein
MSRPRSVTPGRAERSAVRTGRSGGDRPEHSSPISGDHWRLPGAEDEDDIDPAELREFLAADLLDVEADPVFKERLRQKLWRLVRARYGDGSDEG